ncbi:MAG: TldD/PmbA family protein [Thermoproteota archaeon]|jgi:Predicted Zn-dependent proteases and their inactivated homologs
MEDLIYKAIDFAVREGAVFSEVRYQDLKHVSYYFINGRLRGYETGKIKGIGIRVLVDGSFGFASTNILTESEILNTCRKALKIAKNTKIKSKINIERQRAYHDTCIVKPKEAPTEKDKEDVVKNFKDFDNTISEIDSRIALRLFSINANEEFKLYMNSEGSKIEHKAPYIMIHRLLTAFDSQKTVVQRAKSTGGKQGWEIMNDEFIEDLERDSKILSKILNEAKPLKEKGTYDVVIDSEIAALSSHEACGHPFELDRIMGREAAQGGLSYARIDMLGNEKIGVDELNIIDEPLIEKSSGYYVYDDEGVPARKKYLIKNGYVNEFLMNREYASYISAKSNGSARASFYFNEPLIRMSNTYIEKGDYSVEEIIESVKKGIYIKSYMEWNIDDTRWNQKYVGLECYIIENGKIGEMVTNVPLEITTGFYFKNITAIGKDLKFYAGTCGKGDPMQGIPVWFGAPTIKISNVVIR